MSRLALPPPTDAPPDDERRHRHPGRLGAVALVLFLTALLVSAAIFIFLPQPDARHPVTDGPGQASDSVCGLPAGDQSVPTTTPADTTWQLIGTTAAPTGPRLGPGRFGAGLPFCYSRSPMGALYAAANFIAVLSDPRLRLPAAKYLTATGPGRDKWIGTLTASGVGGPGSSDQQIAGFRFINYDQATASLDLAFRVGTKYAHIPFGLTFQAGDWKIVVPDDGNPLAGVAQIPDLSDYVPWSGR
jgi:hypothetical protein